MEPYYEDDLVTLYRGDAADVLPAIDLAGVSTVIADPPYGQTALDWDRWPDGWPSWVAANVPISASMWCFGTMRMFLTRRDEFTGAGWRIAQDTVGEFEVDTTVWEKHNGTGAQGGRFLNVHELLVQWYRGPWADVYNATPRERVHTDDKSVVRQPRPGSGHRRRPNQAIAYTDDGTRLARSVIRAQSIRYRRRNETEKPVAIVAPHIAASCPPGGGLLSMFTGSGTDLVAAQLLGRRAIGIENREDQCEKAAERLSHAPLDFVEVS